MRLILIYATKKLQKLLHSNTTYNNNKKITADCSTKKMSKDSYSTTQNLKHTFDFCKISSYSRRLLTYTINSQSCTLTDTSHTYQLEQCAAAICISTTTTTLIELHDMSITTTTSMISSSPNFVNTLIVLSN